MSAAARSAVLTAQAVLLVLAARWLAVRSQHDDLREPVGLLLLAGAGLFVCAVVIALTGGSTRNPTDATRSNAKSSEAALAPDLPPEDYAGLFDYGDDDA